MDSNTYSRVGNALRHKRRRISSSGQQQDDGIKIPHNEDIKVPTLISISKNDDGKMGPFFLKGMRSDVKSMEADMSKFCTNDLLRLIPHVSQASAPKRRLRARFSKLFDSFLEASQPLVRRSFSHNGAQVEKIIRGLLSSYAMKWTKASSNIGSTEKHHSIIREITEEHGPFEVEWLIAVAVCYLHSSFLVMMDPKIRNHLLGSVKILSAWIWSEYRHPFSCMIVILRWHLKSIHQNALPEQETQNVVAIIKETMSTCGAPWDAGYNACLDSFKEAYADLC